jgi:hypothetical protein
VRVVESGEVSASYAVASSEFRQEHRARLGEAGGFVRFEVHDGSGAIALSNPIWFQRP